MATSEGINATPFPAPYCLMRRRKNGEVLPNRCPLGIESTCVVLKARNKVNKNIDKLDDILGDAEIVEYDGFQGGQHTPNNAIHYEVMKLAVPVLGAACFNLLISAKEHYDQKALDDALAN